MDDPSIMVTPRGNTSRSQSASSIGDVRPRQHGATISQRGLPMSGGGGQSILVRVEESAEDVYRLIDEAKRQGE